MTPDCQINLAEFDDAALCAVLDRVGVPDRYLPLARHLLDADISAGSTLKCVMRDHDKNYLAEHDVVAQLRLKLAQNAGFDAAVTAGFKRVLEAIETRAATTRPKPLSYEVHHEIEVSRDAFFVALEKTGDIAAAEERGISRGLPLDLEAVVAPVEDAPAP